MSSLQLFCKAMEILLCCYVIVSFIPKLWKRIRKYAKENLKNLKKINCNVNPPPIHRERTIRLNEIKEKVTVIARQWEDTQVLKTASQQNVIDTSNSGAEFEGNLPCDPCWSQMSTNLKDDSVGLNKRSSPKLNSESMEEKNTGDKESIDEPYEIYQSRRRSTVSEIAKKFENNETKVRYRMASKAPHIPGSYFEGNKNINGDSSNQRQHKLNGNPTDKLSSEEEIAINKVNNLKRCSLLFGQTPSQQEDQNIVSSYSSSSSSYENVMKQFDIMKNENCCQETSEPLQKLIQIASNSSEEDEMEEEHMNENSSSCWSEFENENELNVTPTNQTSPESLEVKLRKSHDKVQSVEEILKQQRFSRRLSAYSISEFLKDFPNEVDIDAIINDIGK